MAAVAAAVAVTADITTAETAATIAAHLGDFRTLGAMDLAWNYPAIQDSAEYA